jgi:hypothetical protein
MDFILSILFILSITALCLLSPVSCLLGQNVLRAWPTSTASVRSGVPPLALELYRR